jgi:hypothetical protein
MKPINENQADRNTRPVNRTEAIKGKPRPEEDESSSPYVDLDKANFTDRKHGRTKESLGPDHEPGTV